MRTIEEIDADIKRLEAERDIYKVKKVSYQGHGFFQFDADIHILIELDDEEKLVFLVERDVEDEFLYESHFERGFASIIDESEAREWVVRAKTRFEQLYTLI